MDINVLDYKPDEVFKLDSETLIQHGPYNDRIYLMKTSNNASWDLPCRLIKMAKKKSYSKIFAKVPVSLKDSFTEAGFTIEATIPGFYSGINTASFLAYYLNEKRSV